MTIEVGDPQGQRWETVDILVDTGATYTWVPRPLLERLGVLPTFRFPFLLADGGRIEQDMAETQIKLDGQIRTTLVVFGDEGTEPLLGAYTLEGFGLAPDPVNCRLIPVPGLLMKMNRFHATTIIAVRHKGKVAMAGDGQVTLGQTVMKHGAKKIRRLYKDRVLAGFAGTTADALTLFDSFEAKLEQFNGNLMRAAVELAKDWRTDRRLRRLEALLIAVDTEHCLLISGNGDVVEPDDGVIAIGSGGPYALAAARALLKHSDLEAREIAYEAMKIAASICIYTNDSITVEEL